MRLGLKLALGAGAVVVAGIVLGAVTGRLPVRGILTFVQFRLRPDKVRTQQLVQLKHPTTQQVVFLVGTTHQYHYEDPAYSIWHVKAAVTGVEADTVFIEMMRDAVDEGRFGEGPVEMPFIALCAKEAGLRVFGVDAHWNGGWQGRQGQMYEQVKRDLPTSKRAVITSGFMHVQQFQRQLEEDGFVVVDWSDDAKRAVTDRKVDETWPVGLKAALEAAIERARAGKMDTDPARPGDVEWFISIRQQILSKIAG
ncbi:MAG: hypothetical protein Q8O67_02185 [Deltaproteobacteria bacterium]|nr:hypothetical protein [Deltaproteobacteria bacterium]